MEWNRHSSWKTRSREVILLNSMCICAQAIPRERNILFYMDFTKKIPRSDEVNVIL
uniref:Uncharacterized protein n=1 Tax=Lepeophtheirus salmonis TaxID=72036 RepID=A0A0K2UP47_LEPSM